MNLTLTEIDQMRIPLDCLIENGIYMCRNLISISTREKFCILALVQRKRDSIERYCDVRTERLESHVTISHSLGSTGTLLSLKHNIKLFGIDLNRAKLFQKDELTRMKSNKSICIWASNSYSSLVAELDGKVIETINKKNRLLLKNPILGHSSRFNKQHYSYYNDILDSSDLEFLNFTGVFENVTKHWQTIKDVVIKKFGMNSGMGTFQIITITVASVSAAYLLIRLFLFIRKRAKNRQNSYGQSRKIASDAQVSYEKDKTPEINISIVQDSGDASEQESKDARKKDRKSKRAKVREEKPSLPVVDEVDDPTEEDALVFPEEDRTLGRGSDPYSCGARHFCQGADCAFCYARSQCEACKGVGCRVCVKVSEHLNKLAKVGALTIAQLKREVGSQPTRTDQPAGESSSRSVDTKLSSEV